jgi:hypothetical protein
MGESSSSIVTIEHGLVWSGLVWSRRPVVPASSASIYSSSSTSIHPVGDDDEED